MKKTQTMQTRQLVVIALFPALLAVLAQISIPLPFSPVPITGQTFGVFLAAALLGSRGAILAVAAYLLLGTAGLPVFANAASGLPVILGPRGGYLFGFLIGAYFAGMLLERRRQPGVIYSSMAMLLCLLFIYLPGVIQLALVTGTRLSDAFVIGAAPFIPLDLLELVFVVPLSMRLRRTLPAYFCQPSYAAAQKTGANQ